MAAWASFPIAKSLRDMMTDAFDQGVKEGLKKVDSDEEKKLYTRIAELVKSNLGAPEIDLGMAIVGTSPENPGGSHFLIMGGMKVQQGREFERLVREAAAKIKPGENVKITFDTAKAADGTAIHQLSGPFDEKDADLVKRFGKASLFFAFRDDAILFCFGENGLAPLQKNLEGFSNPPAPELDESATILMHVANAGGFADKNQEAFRRAVADVFQGANAKRDRLHLGLKSEGDELRIRLAIDVPAIKLMTVIGNLAK